MRRLADLVREVLGEQLGEAGGRHAGEDRGDLLEPAFERVVVDRLVPGKRDLVALGVADEREHLLDEVARRLDHREREAALVRAREVAREGVECAAVEAREEREAAHRAPAGLRELVFLAAITESVLRHDAPV